MLLHIFLYFLQILHFINEMIPSVFAGAAEFYSPECGDMNPVCACDEAGLAEPGLEPTDLNAGGLWDATPAAEQLGKPFSQPADTRNWASGESSEGAWSNRKATA